MRTKTYPDNEFMTRLRAAFGQALDVEIARRLDVPQSTVARWAKENVLPASALLIRIREVSGVSLDWLLTGEGPQWKTNQTAATEGPLRLADELGETERELLVAQAARNGRTVNAQAIVLLADCLRVEAAMRGAGEAADLTAAPLAARLAVIADWLKTLAAPDSEKH